MIVRLSPIAATIRLPVSDDPVKLIPSIPGWVTRCSPTSRSPGITDSAPFGKAGLLDGAGGFEHRPAGVERGLDDHRVAGGETRADRLHRES